MSVQEISKLLQGKHRLHEKVLHHGTQGNTSIVKDYKATLPREPRWMKNTWWSNISKIQSASDRKDLKMMFGLHQVFDPSSSSMVPLKSKDNMSLIKDPSKILECWQEPL